MILRCLPRGPFAALVAAVAVLVAVLGLRPAGASPGWAAPGTATVYPSMMLYTAGAQCTANFVYTDASGAVYIGQAAHCSSQGASTDTNGCTTTSLPLGTAVEDVSGRVVGTLAYNSWLAMQSAHETDPNACAANDLALVKVDPALVAETSPTMPGLGGPTGVSGGAAGGDQVYAVGNSSLLLGAGSFVAQTGVVEQPTDGGWAYYVAMARPGVPGDSGSGYLDATGAALGQLSTISVGTQGVGNTIGNLGREIAYAAGHGVSGLTVVDGQTPFRGAAGLVTILG